MEDNGHPIKAESSMTNFTDPTDYCPACKVIYQADFAHRCLSRPIEGFTDHGLLVSNFALLTAAEGRARCGDTINGRPIN